MARFRFQLQAVLDHRRMIEQQKQRAVAELESQRVRLESQIRACQDSIVQEREHTRAAMAGADVRAVRMQAAVTGRLAAQAQRVVIELAGLHRRIEAARADLLAAAKARKAVELLRERRYEAWKLDIDRRELAAVDELAVMRAGRRGDDS